MNAVDFIRRRTYGSAMVRLTRHNMQSSGLNDLFTSRPNGTIPPQSVDLWNLYSEVIKYKPQTIVEFGVGYSTVVMAEALRRNGAGHLYSIDASQEWLEVTRSGLPDQVRPFVTLSYSPCEMMSFSGTEAEDCHRYTVIPDTPPIDMILLDAPSAADVPGWPAGEGVVAADPALLQPRLSNRFRMIIDAREKNTDFLRRHMTRHRFSTNALFKITTVTAP